MAQELSGVRKAAVLLLSLQQDQAAEILKRAKDEKAEYARLISTGGPDPTELTEIPETIIRKWTEPKRLKLEEIWANKEIFDKIPTVNFGGVFTDLDGGPYPSSSKGPIYTFSDNITNIRGNHTIKAGFLFERAGQNDFDQINVGDAHLRP